MLRDAASPQTDLGSACVSGVSVVGSAGLQTSSGRSAVPSSASRLLLLPSAARSGSRRPSPFSSVCFPFEPALCLAEQMGEDRKSLILNVVASTRGLAGGSPVRRAGPWELL